MVYNLEAMNTGVYIFILNMSYWRGWGENQGKKEKGDRGEERGKRGIFFYPLALIHTGN